MHGLDLAYKLLSISGFWIPTIWQEKMKLKWFYKIYSSFIVTCICVMTSLQALLIVTSELNLQFFADMFFTLLLAISFSVKGAVFLLRRNRIIRLGDMLKEIWCLPTDSEEFRLQNEMNDFIRKLTLVYNLISQLTLLLFFIKSALQDEENRALPTQIWLPYDLRQDLYFWITLFAEYAILLPSILLNVSSSVVVASYILQASTQYDFIKRRIHRLCEVVENEIVNGGDQEMLRNYQFETLKKCVKHHNHIVRFLKALTETANIILIQIYLASVLFISVIVYEFSTGGSSVMHKVTSVAYLLCMIGEILAYSWFCNELALKSTAFGYNDYTTNWMVLSKESKKMLRFMALRATHPTVISFSGVINLNLESFKTIMKVTYSAFNLMKKFS